MAAASLVLPTNKRLMISLFPQLLYLPFRNCPRFQELQSETLISEEFQKRLHPYKVKKKKSVIYWHTEIEILGQFEYYQNILPKVTNLEKYNSTCFSTVFPTVHRQKMISLEASLPKSGLRQESPVSSLL